MIHSYLIIVALICLSLVSPIDAAFGLGKKKDKDAANDNKEAIVDLDDPELLAAMEEFALMSDEEAADAFADVIEMLGDDPETIEAVQQVMAEMKNMDANDVKSALNSMTMEDEIAEATQIALDMVSKSEWDVIYDKREDILNSVIASGKISAEDAALFKSDKKAWEKELRFIWEELQSQAKEAAAGSAKKEEL